MRVLMTTDAVGGVWQYSLALARGLVERHDCRVTLVCFGEPSEHDAVELVAGGRVELIPLRRKLEWMPDSAADVEASIEDVARLATTWRADLIHSNQFCFGGQRSGGRMRSAAESGFRSRCRCSSIRDATSTNG